MGQWSSTLRCLADDGLAPAASLAADPNAIFLSDHQGADRPELPAAVQAALVTLLESTRPRRPVRGQAGTAPEVLAEIATYAGLHGELLDRVVRTRTGEAAINLARNPQAPPDGLRRLALRRSTNRRLVAALILNPRTPDAVRLRLFRRAVVADVDEHSDVALPDRVARSLARTALRALRRDLKGTARPDDPTVLANTLLVLRDATGLIPTIDWVDLAIHASLAAGTTFRHGELDRLVTADTDAEIVLTLADRADPNAPSTPITAATLASCLEELRASLPPARSTRWARRPTFGQYVASLDSNAARLDEMLTSPSSLIARCALARKDPDWVLERALRSREGLSTAQIEGPFAALSPPAKLRMLDHLVSQNLASNQAAGLIELATRCCSELDPERLSTLTVQLLEKHPSLSSYQFGQFWRAFAAAHPSQIAVIRPARYLAGALSGQAAASWLRSELSEAQLATFFTLVDDFEGSAADLTECCRAVAD